MRMVGNQMQNGLMSNLDKVKWLIWNCRKQLIIIRCLSNIYKEMQENQLLIEKKNRRRKRRKMKMMIMIIMMVVKILVTLN